MGKRFDSAIAWMHEMEFCFGRRVECEQEWFLLVIFKGVRWECVLCLGLPLLVWGFCWVASYRIRGDVYLSVSRQLWHVTRRGRWDGIRGQHESVLALFINIHWMNKSFAPTFSISFSHLNIKFSLLFYFHLQPLYQYRQLRRLLNNANFNHVPFISIS